MPLTRPELDELTAHGCGDHNCGDKDCKTLFLHARCHKSRGVAVSYRNGSGVLRLSCPVCDKVIAMVAVTDGDAAAGG